LTAKLTTPSPIWQPFWPAHFHFALAAHSSSRYRAESIYNFEPRNLKTIRTLL